MSQEQNFLNFWSKLKWCHLFWWSESLTVMEHSILRSFGNFRIPLGKIAKKLSVDCYAVTRREHLESALYLRLKISKNWRGTLWRLWTIFEKKRKMRIPKKSLIAKKFKRGDPLGFLKLQFAAKYQNKLERGPFGDKKISKKSRTVPKKPKRGTLYTHPVL